MSTVRPLLMDAIACNAEQQRLLYNPTSEIDSALEHAICAARLTTGPAREHILAVAQILAHVQTSNRTEGERVRTVAGQVNGRTARDPFAYRRLAAMLRPALANVCNPTVVGERHREAEQTVLDVLTVAPPERIGTRERPNATLRNELGRGEAGARKYDALLALIERSRV